MQKLKKSDRISARKFERERERDEKPMIIYGFLWHFMPPAKIILKKGMNRVVEVEK